MPVIMYEGKNIHTVSVGRGPKGDLTPFEYRFLPGPNEVPAGDWKRLQKESPGCANLIGMGRLKPLVQRPPVRKAEQPKDAEEPGKPKRVEVDAAEGAADTTTLAGSQEVESLADADVSKMDAWAARDLIQSVVDKDMLLKFREQEKAREGDDRKMVMEALDVQIKAMDEKVAVTGGEGGGQQDLGANAGRQ